LLTSFLQTAASAVIKPSRGEIWRCIYILLERRGSLGFVKINHAMLSSVAVALKRQDTCMYVTQLVPMEFPSLYRCRAPIRWLFAPDTE